MTSDATLSRPALPLRTALLLAGVLLVGELVALSLIYKSAIDFTCHDNWPIRVCGAASGALVSLIVLIAAMALFAMLSLAPLRDLAATAGQRRWPLLVNLGGLLIALVPVGLLYDGVGTSTILPAFACWIIGMSAILIGLGLFVAPLPRWHAFWRAQRWRIGPLAITGLAVPYLATQIRPLWRLDQVADVTFGAVSVAIRLLGYSVEADPEEKIIGAGNFFINVAPVCSGIEGIALVAIFVTIYLVLFRQEIRFPHAFLLYPIGFAVSAALNIVRITVLLAVGLSGNPDLAVGGFHSHAGWLMFSLVAVGLIALARRVPALRKVRPQHVHRDLPGLLEDPNAARILPFAVFMFSALLASTFSQTPGTVYPLRMLMVAATLALFWPLYKGLLWRVSAPAVGVGIAIGLFWVLLPATPAPAPYGNLEGAWLTGWLIVRGLGTILLVPIVEELFFRDYLETRLRGAGGRWRGVIAAVISAAIFAALHGRWLEAFIAGLALSYVARRRERIGEAILAHAVANAIVFAVALATQRMYII